MGDDFSTETSDDDRSLQQYATIAINDLSSGKMSLKVSKPQKDEDDTYQTRVLEKLITFHAQSSRAC